MKALKRPSTNGTRKSLRKQKKNSGRTTYVAKILPFTENVKQILKNGFLCKIWFVVIDNDRQQQRSNKHQKWKAEDREIVFFNLAGFAAAIEREFLVNQKYPHLQRSSTARQLHDQEMDKTLCCGYFDITRATPLQRSIFVRRST